MKTLCVMITHIITTLLTQAAILAVQIWYYDIHAEEIVLYVAICILSVLADYLICARVLHKESLVRPKRLLFLTDLILVIPGVLLAAQEIIGEGANTSKSVLCAIIFMLAINAVLITERLVLIRVKK